MTKQTRSSLRAASGNHWVVGLLAFLLLPLLLLLMNEKNWRPVKDKPTWAATANYGQKQTELAIDRKIETAWSSRVNMSSGMYFQIELETQRRVNGLVLHADEAVFGSKPILHGHPREWLVKVSSDGLIWQTIVPLRHVKYRSMLTVFWRPVHARYVQIIQTSVDSSSPWKIHELDLLQPVVPWQFTRASLIPWLIAWWIVALAFFVYFSPYFRNHRIFSIHRTFGMPAFFIVLLGLLGGWGMRVKNLAAYDFSPENISYFSIVDFEQANHLQWIAEYFRRSTIGESWLYLVSARFANQIVQNPHAAFRLIPALLGLALSLLILFPGIFSIIPSGDKRRLIQSDIVEKLIAALLINFSGVCIGMTAQGDMAIILLFFLTAYALLAYRFLYQQSSPFWLPVLSGVMLVGVSFNPALEGLPFIILLVAALTPAMPSGSGKPRLFRRLLLVLSITPLPLAWKLFGQAPMTSIDFSLQNYTVLNIRQLSEYSGFTGAFSVIWWSVSLVGFYQFIRSRRQKETFFYRTACAFALLLHGFSHLSHLSTSIFTLLLLLLSAKGISTSYAWVVNKFLRGSLRSYESFAIASLLLSAGYSGGFAYNSLYRGAAAFPFAPGLFQRTAQQNSFNNQLHELRNTIDDDCMLIATFEPALVKYLSEIDGVPPVSARLSKMLRQADRGKLLPYLLISKRFEQNASPELLDFFQQYYTEYARSEHIGMYQLQEKFQGVTRRYLADDLIRKIGRRVPDNRAVSGKVLVATPDNSSGWLVFHPSIRLCTSGFHTARFILQSTGGSTDEDDVVAILRVAADKYTVLARQKLRIHDFSDSAAYQAFEVTFNIPDDNPAYRLKRIQLQVYVTGTSEVRVDYIDLIPPQSSSVF